MKREFFNRYKFWAKDGVVYEMLEKSKKAVKKRLKYIYGTDKGFVIEKS